MRYSEIINEAIQNRPRHLGTYVKNAIAKLTLVIAEMERGAAVVQQHEQSEKLLTDILRYGSGDDEAAYAVSDIVRLAHRHDRVFPFVDLMNNLRSYRDHGSQFLGYVLNTFKYATHLHQEARDAFNILDTAEKGAIDYGFQPNDPDPEYRDAMALLAGLKEMRSAIQKGEMIWSDITAKLGEVKKASDMSSSWSGVEYRPDHDEVEKLYHATAFMTEILRDGFQAEKPIERRGLGNYGEQATVSFTHDLEIARNLMRCFKELWMIAHGQLTARHIKDWIEREGLKKSLLGLLPGGPQTYPGMHTEHDAVILYRYWLALNKHRVDPVFTFPERTMEMMKDRKLEDIGVLECDVRLTPEDEYKAAESEFRVPADRVLRVRRKL